MNTKLSVFCSKIIEAGWLSAVIAVPLFFNIYSARTFEPDKITLMRSIAAIMVLAWLVMIVEQGFSTSEPFKDRLKRWLKTPFFLPTALFVLIYIISAALSISPKVSLWGSYQRLQGAYSVLSYIAIFALMAANMRTREQIDRLVTTIIIASIPISFYGIIQRNGLDPLPWAGDVTRRVASNMGNAIFVASYLIMVIPLTMSRLIKSMLAIIHDEDASWGYTILAAVYIFALAVQFITVVFSGSRGPMLGILGAAFVMGLLYLLILRQLAANRKHLTAKEVGAGLGFLIPLGLVSAIAGGIGYAIGLALDGVLVSTGVQFDRVPELGAVVVGLLGFLGGYVYMAVSERGWRWLWLSWLGIAVAAISLMLLLNTRGTWMDTYLDPLRSLPFLNQMSRVTAADSGSGKVRVLIWDAAMGLIVPHEPLGIAEDNVADSDTFNALRPLVGYGPESMFNAFAYVYPPALAHIESRGSSADRAHNETIDSLVITGIFGFAVFYFLMITLFYYALQWLGWAPDRSARLRLIALLIIGGLVGTAIPYSIQGSLTFMPVGLPFGLITGIIVHLLWQASISQPEESSVHSYTLLLIGVLGALVGHFIEVHFVFSIAATYTYFWVYLGLLIGIYRTQLAEAETETVAADANSVVAAEASSSEEEEQPEPESDNRSKRRRRRARKKKQAEATAPAGYVYQNRPESWEMWLGSQGLVMSIILMILTFDFVTPQFELHPNNEKSMALFWMMSITWLVGFAIALSDLAVRRSDWQNPLSWGRSILLYVVTSLFYFFFYAIAHRAQFATRITVSSIEDVITAANVLTGGLVLFYVALFVLMMIIALTLSWGRVRNLVFWRSENWWLYPPLALAILAIIWFKNVDVVRADMYLKEGERYRNNKQWNQAVALHEKARSLDSDEDFYYLQLALDYQLMAQDGNLGQAERQQAWLQGERIALEAREINPYNPDNTGNMGRYYFTLGQVFSRDKFQDALSFFEKSVALAPSNVIYHNLWAQTHYILQDYDKAIDRLQTSISIDGRYPPTWVLLGDTYAAKGDIEKALEAHREGMLLTVNGSDGWRVFADQFVDQRLNFYVSAGRANDIIAAMEDVATARNEALPENAAEGTITALNRLNAEVARTIGQVYNLQGNQEAAIAYYDQARTLGDESDRTIRSLANLYLAANDLGQALANYQLILEKNDKDVEANSAAAYIYAQQGNIEQAIHHNQQVLQQSPGDYDSLKNLAILFQQKQDWPAARSHAEQAMAAAPENEKPSWEQFMTNIDSQVASGN